MGKKKKMFFCMCLLAAALVVLSAGCTKENKTQEVSTVSDGKETVQEKSQISSEGNTKELFQIEQQTCTLAQAKVYMVNYQNIYGRQYGINLMQQEDKLEDFENYIKNMAVTQLAQTVCMVELANERDITLTEKQQKRVEQAADEYFESLTPEEIEYFSATQESVQQMYENYALSDVLYAFLTDDVNEEVSDDEARIMQAQQMVISSKETADAVAEKLNAGEEFAVLAADYNEADAVEITFGRGYFPTEVEEAVFGLENGECTGCIETEQGYYFVYCVNKFDETLTAENKKLIAKQRQSAAFASVYDEYITEVSSRLNEGTWKLLGINTNEELVTDSFFTTFEKYWQS